MQGSRISIKESDGRRGMAEALTHVGKGWFPANSAVLNLVRGRMRDGSYEGQVSLLFSDLKKDLSLFTFCLKQVGKVIDGPVKHRSPAEILGSLEVEKIAEIISLAESSLGLHSIDPTQKAQVMRLRHSIVSSSTAEVLAEKAKLDSNQAFLLATVRQLGLNLVAWNYPRIYAKALVSAGKGEGELEELLFKTLGYSPLELGVKSSLDWCHHADTRAVLFSDDFAGGLGNDSQVTQQAEKYREFCEAGELLAKLHDPEFFPKAAARWQGVSQGIERLLGPTALQVIQSRAEQQGSSYLNLLPGALKLDFSPETALRDAIGSLCQRLFEQNGYAVKCPTLFAEQFRSVYRQIAPGQPSPAAIKALVEIVIPSLGFVRGCVYLVDQKKLQAVPMLRIGDATIDRYRSLSCGDSGKAAHPVVEALSYSAPIVQEDVFLNGDQVSHVTGVFGNEEKLGVLYLEMSPSLRTSDRQQTILYFKAIRETLNDSLNMRA